eukprot:TRINITY_DN32110_c0_g1_i1.p1 TRINITY_DN32110_c0_g1~~TRINITY_DN32110_c0_g1_i1.p1  ORF type:complete len:340 (+),score=49.21 TRINITY_DN32110_c0_g1_i1:86-1105(+)
MSALFPVVLVGTFIACTLADTQNANSVRPAEGAGSCEAKGIQRVVGMEENIPRRPNHHLLLQVGKNLTSVHQVALPDHVRVSTFFWNVHWECSMAAGGASKACKQKIGKRFVELAQEAGASIAASIELADSASSPASLVNFGLSGWTQVDGPCKGDNNGDSAALAFAPGWRVEKSGGGCLRDDWDTRAMAVALVVPPSVVKNCPLLCFLVVHAPHTAITKGSDLVHSVCGDAAEHCTVAMGDWNTPADGVGRLWADLVGGAPPVMVQPNERTCCFPESDHYGVFDHVATNIDGARHDHDVVHPYQHVEDFPLKQHRAVSSHFLLPSANPAERTTVVQTF